MPVRTGDLRLWGRPIGGQDAAFTETVVVHPGQWVEWTLESDLDQSATGVYQGATVLPGITCTR
jgi:hypothetical protein